MAEDAQSDSALVSEFDYAIPRRSLLRSVGVGVVGTSVLASNTATAAEDGPYDERVTIGPFPARTVDVGTLTESDPPISDELQGGQEGSAEEVEIATRTPNEDGSNQSGENSGVLSGDSDVLSIEKDFDGLNTLDVQRERFGTVSGVVPGDPVVAASNEHIVTCVNSDIAFVSKENAPDGGTRVRDTDGVGDEEYLSVYRTEDWFGNVLEQDMGISNPNLFENILIGDPRVRYDKEAKRFITTWLAVSIEDPETFDIGTGAYLLSVSATSQPNGEWHNYLIPPKKNVGVPDYPTLGYDADGIYLSQNFFAQNEDLDFFFDGATFDIVDKSAVLDGDDLTVYEFTKVTEPDGGAALTLQPADAPGESAAYAVSSRFFQGQQLTVWVVTEGDDSSPDLNNSAVRVPPYTNPVDGAPQPDTEDQIDMPDNRILDTTYDPSDATLWATHTVNDRSVRWYELDPTGPDLLQTQTFKRRGLKTYLPAIGTNGDSTLLVYNTSSGDNYVSVEVAGRRSEVESGDLEDYATVQEGEQTYDYINEGDQTAQTLRWGDYYAVSVDPNDDSYWVVGQYGNQVTDRPSETEIYGTRIANVAFDD